MRLTSDVSAISEQLIDMVEFEALSQIDDTAKCAD